MSEPPPDASADAPQSNGALQPQLPAPVDDTNNENDDSDQPPTAEQWSTMKRYGSFITHDEQNQEFTFHLNDVIYVVPTDKDPDADNDASELWLAQIKSIRAYNPQSVWIRAKWFYHPNELPKRIKGASSKQKDFGYCERVSSNLADFISTATCSGVASIMAYDEKDFEQADIEDGVFYYRCDYDWQQKTLTRTAQPCTICKTIYNPDTDMMHFCPRSDCRRAWHTRCLEREQRLILSPVNFNQRMESLDKPALCPSEDPTGESPKKRRRAAAPAPAPTARPPSSRTSNRIKGKAPTSTATAAVTVTTAPASALTDVEPDSYNRIPVGLLAVARQPIVRGGKDLGIVGNVRSVTRARKMVQQALRGEEDIPDDWEARVGKVHDLTDVPGVGPGESVKRRKKALAFMCPQCGEPI